MTHNLGQSLGALNYQFFYVLTFCLILYLKKQAKIDHSAVTCHEQYGLFN